MRLGTLKPEAEYRSVHATYQCRLLPSSIWLCHSCLPLQASLS